MFYNWNESVYSCSDANVAYDNFSSFLKHSYDKCFPLIKQSRKRSKDKKWITTGIIKSSNRKSQLYKKWITSRDQQDKTNYANYSKAYSKIIKAAQANYYKNTFDSKSHDIKSLWKQINNLHSFTPRTSATSSKISKLQTDNDVITDAGEIASLFNNYFCNVGKNLATNLPHSSSTNNFNSFLPPPIQNSFVCEYITHLEIFNSIAKLATKNSSGPDDFKAKFIIQYQTQLIPLLCYIFNLSINSGIFPSALKIAKTVPIYKKGPHSCMGNYRPIFVTYL